MCMCVWLFDISAPVFWLFCLFTCVGGLVMNGDPNVLMMSIPEICACATIWQRLCTFGSLNVYTHLVMDRYFSLCVLSTSSHIVLSCDVPRCSSVRVITYTCRSLHVCLCLKPRKSSCPLIKGAMALFMPGWSPCASTTLG